MADPSTTGLEPSHDSPQRVFASLGFGFVHWFLWLVLSGCFLALSGGMVLGWVLDGDVTVKAEGALRPTSRHLVKSAIDGRVEDVRVRAGDRVAAEDILVVLSPRGVRGRLTQVERELDLSDTRRQRLASQIDHDRLVLTAMLAARRLDIERALFSLEYVRREQQLYTEHARARWVRRDLEELVPVRESASVLAQAEAQFAITRRQLEANAARLADLQLERQTWMQLDAERRNLWQQLENTVIRAPVDGVVLTGDLDLRIGDRVQVGEALLELAQDNAWSARVLIQQIDRPKVKTGQRARVFIRAYPHLEYGVLEGHVAEIAEQAAADGTGYPVDVVLDTTALALLDGMAAEVRVTVDSGRLLQLVWKRLLRELGRVPVPEVRQAQG
jgi:multidrug resistance efflux pump